MAPSDAFPPTLLLTKRGTVVAANARANELFDSPCEGADPWPPSFPARYRESWDDAVARAAEGQRIDGLVLRGADPRRFFQWSLAWSEPDKAIVAVGIDVTDTVGRSQLYEQILDAIFDFVLVKGPHSRLQWANRSFREYYGMTNAQLRDLLDAPFNAPDYTQQYVREDAWVWEHKQPLHIACEPVTRWDGVVRRFETIKSPFVDDEGQMVFTVGVSRDITETLEAEERSIRTSKMAALGEMASGIAHEINNPLTVISAKARQLRVGLETESPTVENLTAALAAIERNSARIAKIVRGLQRLSREASGDPFEEASLDEIVEETLSLCRERFASAGIALDVARFPSRIVLRCRPVQISQVVLNLLNNAYDAVKNTNEPRIEIRMSKTPQTAVIQVLDSGPGVPAELEAKIMQPFFTTKPAGQGTGLGLSISSVIAHEHGGSLRLDRSVGKSCFVLELSLDPAQP